MCPRMFKHQCSAKRHRAICTFGGGHDPVAAVGTLDSHLAEMLDEMTDNDTSDTESVSEMETTEVVSREILSHDNAVSDTQTESTEVVVFERATLDSASSDEQIPGEAANITVIEPLRQETDVDAVIQYDSNVPRPSTDESQLSQTITHETAFFKLGNKKIRKTPDAPLCVSVYDLISAITYQNIKHARSTFERMKESYPEVPLSCSYLKFSGAGQRETPVTKAKGAVMIMNLLPGPKAAQFRLACADILVRYLGGDESLVAEIRRNRDLQETAESTDPVSLFGNAARPTAEFHETNSLVLQSVTNIVDLRAPQHYMRQVFGRWSHVHPVGRPQEILSAEELARVAVVKNGSQGESTGRQLTHTSAFPNSKLLDSCLTLAYTHVEMKAKDHWINSGELYEGLCEGKTVRDTELLLVRDQAEYERRLIVVQQLCHAESDSYELQLAQEKTKQIEAEARKAQADVKHKQIELEMLRLQFEIRKFDMSHAK